MKIDSHWFGQFFLRGILFAALCAVLGWQWQQLLGQPPCFFPKRIELSLAPGESRVVGRAELAARQGDKDHVRLRRDMDGSWWIRNASESREVEVRRAGHDEMLRSQVLTRDLRFSVGGAWFSVVSLDSGRLELLDDEGVVWSYDGSLIRREGNLQKTCSGISSIDSLRRNWNVVAPAFLSLKMPLEFGGLLACDNRVPVTGMALGAARVMSNKQGQFVLRAGNDAMAARKVCVSTITDPQETIAPLHDLEMPLNGVSQLVVGRTYYDVALDNSRISLMPRRHVQTYGTGAPNAPEGVRWLMAEQLVWQWPFAITPWLGASLWLLSVGLGGALIQWRCYGVDSCRALLMAGGTGLGCLGVLSYFLGTSLGVGWTLVLESISVLLMVLIPRRKFMAMLSLGLAALLLAIGLAAQQSLGYGVTETDGLRYFQSSSSVAVAGLSMLFAFVVWLRNNRVIDFGFARLEAGLVLVAFSAMSAMFLEVVAGGETGVFGVQPVELAKYALVLLSAHAFALRLAWVRDDRGMISSIVLWWRFMLPVAMFLLLLVVSLLLVRDFSPVVLLAAWAFGLLLAWSLASGRALAFVLLVILSVMVGVALWWLTISNGLETLGRAGLYSDRLNVWMDPALHPHTGDQFRRAIALAGQGGEYGSDANYAWQVPEIQNDFAPTYFLARFGALGGAVLVSLQVLYLATLLSLGWDSLSGIVHGDFRSSWAGRLRFFALWGGAFMIAGHFVISWGTNLGWLPVMGQPMPFLSAAGSLIAFFVLPLQVMGVGDR